MFKKILFIILILGIAFIAIAQPEEKKEPPPVQHIKIIETNGYFFLFCIDGQKAFAIIHGGGAAIILLPDKCDCGESI